MGQRLVREGRDWQEPAGKYAVAQLTLAASRWPESSRHLRRLFGYGYLPLPLTAAKATTGGKNVPTGDNCWTLFLNTRNFKGPVCFFTPYFWSHSAEVNPDYAGLLLDSRPSAPNKPFQMETQYVPAALSVDEKGETYARVAPTSFPVGPDGSTVVLHRLTSYNKKALWDDVKAWFEGGSAVSGAIDPPAPMCRLSRPRAARPGRSMRGDCEGREGARCLEFLSPLPSCRIPHLRLQVERSTRGSNDPKTARVVAPRVLSPPQRRTRTEATSGSPVRSKSPAETGLIKFASNGRPRTPRSPTTLPTTRRAAGRSPVPWPDRSRRSSATAAS